MSLPVLVDPDPAAFAAVVAGAARVEVLDPQMSVTRLPAKKQPALFKTRDLGVIAELTAALAPVANTEQICWMSAGVLQFRFLDDAGRSLSVVELLDCFTVRCAPFYDAAVADPARLKGWLDEHGCYREVLGCDSSAQDLQSPSDH